MGCIFFLTCFCFYCKFPRTKYHLIIALMLNFQALGPPPRTLTALDPLAVVNKQKKKKLNPKQRNLKQNSVDTARPVFQYTHVSSTCTPGRMIRWTRQGGTCRPILFKMGVGKTMPFIILYLFCQKFRKRLNF